MDVLAASGIQKTYGQGAARIVAVAATDLRVEEGEFLMVAGPSGSGKSTLLAIISGLLRPTTGRVEVLGRDLADLTRDEFDHFRLAHFGFVFQGFHLLPALTAVEQVSIVLEQQGLGRAAAHERARHTLDRVGLANRFANRPAELSGGERQRVAIARALAKHPQLIFADEPTSALDSENGRQIALMLRAVAREDGATIICVTHDPRLMAHASRVVRMEDGELCA